MGSGDPLLALVTECNDPVTCEAVLCRAGHYDKTIKLLSHRSEAVALLYRALADHGRGHPTGPQAALEQAEKWLKAPDEGNPEQTNTDRMT